MFAISRKLWTPPDSCWLVPPGSTLFWYVYFVILDICNMHFPSLVTLSTVHSLSHFSDSTVSPQPYLIVFAYVFSVPYSFLILLHPNPSTYSPCIHSYLLRIKIAVSYISQFVLSLCLLSLWDLLWSPSHPLLISLSLDSGISRVQNSHTPSHLEIQDPWGIPQGTGQYPESTLVIRIRCYIDLLITSFSYSLDPKGLSSK